MTKIIAGILTFLLWIMPWWSGLSGLRERLTFDRNAVMDKIIDYVQNQDVAGLEAMMRPWFKSNTTNLTAKLGEFYDAIDGNIVTVQKGTSEGSMNDRGIRSERLNFVVHMDGDANYSKYYIVIWYDVANTKDRKDVGISLLELSTGDFVLDPDYMIHFELYTPEWN